MELVQDDRLRNPIATVSVDTEGRPLDAKSTAVRWLFGQPAIVVILLAILGVCIYLGYWHVTVGEPASTARHDAFIRELNTANNLTHEKNMNQCTIALEKIANQNSLAVEKLAIQTTVAADKVAAQNTASVEKLQNSLERFTDKLEQRLPRKD